MRRKFFLPEKEIGINSSRLSVIWVLIIIKYNHDWTKDERY